MFSPNIQDFPDLLQNSRIFQAWQLISEIQGLSRISRTCMKPVQMTKVLPLYLHSSVLRHIESRRLVELWDLNSFLGFCQYLKMEWQVLWLRNLWKIPFIKTIYAAIHTRKAKSATYSSSQQRTQLHPHLFHCQATYKAEIKIHLVSALQLID